MKAILSPIALNLYKTSVESRNNRDGLKVIKNIDFRSDPMYYLMH